MLVSGVVWGDFGIFNKVNSTYRSLIIDSIDGEFKMLVMRFFYDLLLDKSYTNEKQVDIKGKPEIY